MERFYTDFLVSDCSFLTGAGSIFNVGGNFYVFNRSGTREAADARAIHQDFAMIGQDIRDVIKELEEEKKKQLCLAL